jgi:hypothetical protein
VRGFGSTNYPNNVNCVFTAWVPGQATLTYVGIEGCNNCWCNFLDIGGTRYCNAANNASHAVALALAESAFSPMWVALEALITPTMWTVCLQH